MNANDQAAAFARDNFLAYCIGLDDSFLVGPHHLKIAKKLKDIAEGKIKRAMIFMPPRHGKSRLISHEFVPWWMGHNPNKSVIFTTYNQDLASEFGRKVRNRFYDDLYRVSFPNCKLTDDSTASKRFHTTTGGTYYAVGIGGPLTGRGGDLIIIDDPIKNREEASSELIRQKIKDWYTSTLRTRLMNDGSIIIVQTRWHKDDVSGWLLDQEGNTWDVLSLPAINDKGEALWPERFDIDFLNEAKKDIGSRDFESLYQQSPVDLEGNLFKRKWWQYYSELPNQHKIVQFWDCAQKVGISNDYSVCSTWAQGGNGYYLLDVWRQKVEAPQLEQAVQNLYMKFKPEAVVIEDKSSGSSVIQNLRQKTRLPIIAYDPKMRDKEVRASAATPLVESGNCYLLRGADWVEDFISECEQFPSGKHDDQVDTLSMMAEYFRTRTNHRYSIRTL